MILFLFTDTAIAEDTVLEVVKVNTRPECNQYRELVEKHDWNVDVMMKIMEAESGCRSQIINDNPKSGDYSIGLFQINLFGGNAKHRPSEEELKKPEVNVEWAYKIFKEQGISAWGVCRKIKCS